jgi:hypothetical protein
MEFVTLSRLLRQSFEHELKAGAELPGRSEMPELELAALTVDQMVELMRESGRSLQEQDQVLTAVIRCYRRAPTPAWSAVLLEMLSPTLVASSSRFPSLPRGMTVEDLQQQVVVEALHAARHMVLPAEERFTLRWLRDMVISRTARVLWRAAKAEEEEVEGDAESADAGERALRLGAEPSQGSEQALSLIGQARAQGMSVKELVLAMGASGTRLRVKGRADKPERTQTAKNQRFASDKSAAA